MAHFDVVLVFIGESGSGKSTCINYFANFFAGTGYKQQSGFSNVHVVIPNNLFPQAIFGYASSERNIRDNTKSQTTKCNEYDFVWLAEENLRVKVVDTPGFNDTDDTRDEANIRMIITAIAMLPFISAIIITINGTIARLSTSIKTTLSQLRGSLPDSIFENLFFVFTNCEEMTRNFKLEVISEYKPEPRRTFHMQNSLFSATSKADIDSDSKKQRRADSNWQDSFETMNDLMSEVKRTATTSTKVFADMRLKREQLSANKANLLDKQKSLLSSMSKLALEQERLRNAELDQSNNANYTENQMIERIQIEEKSYYSTICTEHGKVTVCHKNCGLRYQPEVNYAHFRNCAAADSIGNNCRKCRCGMNQHLHTYQIPVSRRVTIEQIVQSKKAAFDLASQQVNSSQWQLYQLNATYFALQNESNGCKDGILSSIKALKTICSHYNFAEEMVNTIQKLRQEAKITQDLSAKSEFNNTAQAIENLIKQMA